MAKKVDEQFESVEHEISGMWEEVQKLPVIEEKLSSVASNIEKIGMQVEKQQQQQ